MAGYKLIDVRLTEDEIRDILFCIEYRIINSPYPPYEKFYHRHAIIQNKLSIAVGDGEMYDTEEYGN